MLFVNKFKNTFMSRTMKLDLIKSSYRLAALIILISININTLSAQTATAVIGGRTTGATATSIGTTSPNTYSIGESYGGGIVFHVTDNGLHGLIAETQYQLSFNCNWFIAQDVVSTSKYHSTAGKLFTDWRLPTMNELNILYKNKDKIGGFNTECYWSSTEVDFIWAVAQSFKNGIKSLALKYDHDKNLDFYYVRAIRSF